MEKARSIKSFHAFFALILVDVKVRCFDFLNNKPISVEEIRRSCSLSLTFQDYLTKKAWATSKQRNKLAETRYNPFSKSFFSIRSTLKLKIIYLQGFYYVYYIIILSLRVKKGRQSIGTCNCPIGSFHRPIYF